MSRSQPLYIMTTFITYDKANNRFAGFDLGKNLKRGEKKIFETKCRRVLSRIRQ